MHELLQLTTGLVFKKDATSQPAKNLDIGDDIDIIRILYGLAALQSRLERGKGLGNITKAAIQRTASGRLVLFCVEPQPSKCELTAANDDDARYFVHVGEKPQQIDDLVSLGVTLAELLIPPGNRPALSATYREDLAAKIPRRAFRRSDRLRNQIVRWLLLSDKGGIQTTSEFLRHYVPLVRMTGDMKLKPAGWYDAMRAFPKLAIAGFVVLALAIVCGVVVWMDQQSLRSTRDKLNITTGENGNLVSKVNELEANATNLTKDLENRKSEVKKLELEVAYWKAKAAGGPNPDPPKRPIEVVTNDPRYRWFKDDVNLKNDKRFQSILSKSQIDKEEETYADQRLTDFNTAAKEWWKMVEDEATLEEIESRIKGQTDPEVEAALEVWRAQARTPHDYVIELNKSTVPKGYKDYAFRLTIRHQDKDEQLEATANSELILADPPGNKKLRLIPVRWKAGQPINLYLESWSYTNFNWNNWVATELNGGLALPLLEKRIFGSKEEFALDFTVKGHPGLPGPPVDSAGEAPTINLIDLFKPGVSAGGPTSANGKTNPRDGGDAKAKDKAATTPLNPRDELK